MSVVIFCGPTLSVQDCSAYREFEFRPPVRQGELFAAARTGPRTIGVVDGYFDGQPAVWHKEILWALSQGISVFGASSMGALRAAELHSFGMRGIGVIFEAYRDGGLTDDDEVALIHGPAETGYVRLSEPMVNLRATLRCAVAEGIIDAQTGERLTAAAKSRFYQRRDWPSLLDALDGDDASASARLSGWIKHGKVDQKRDDALAMLAAIREFERRDEPPVRPDFSFEWTESWANAPWRVVTDEGEARGGELDGAILDELRLGGRYCEVRRDALLRALANGRIRPEAVLPDCAGLKRESMAFRTARGLLRKSDVLEWCEENSTELAQLERMMADRVSIEMLARAHDAGLHPAMLDRLRELNLYLPLRGRALSKREISGASSKLPLLLLASSHFERRLGTAVPDDLADYALSIGLKDVERFNDLLAAEYAFRWHRTRGHPGGRRGR